MRYKTLHEQEGWYTLEEVLIWLKTAKEPIRYQVRPSIVRDLLNVKSIRAAYDTLGCGRTSYGVGIYCLTCSKEVWPPQFWIGHC